MGHAQQVGTLISLLARLTDNQRAYILGHCCAKAPDTVIEGLAKLQTDEFFKEQT